jgi:ADP-heptose:LPS heptosyltransferase
VAHGRTGAVALLGGLGLSGTKFAVVAPGASRAQQKKKPPAELLAAGCDRLSARGVVPLVVWGPGEQEDAQAVVARCRDRAMLAPPTDLPLLGALLEEARVFLGGDSGPMHLACSVECPVVALYGPTDPQVNQPWGVPFQAVFPPGRHYTGIRRQDRESGGFSGLRREQVEEAVERVLVAASRPRQGPARLQPNR